MRNLTNEAALSGAKRHPFRPDVATNCWGEHLLGSVTSHRIRDRGWLLPTRSGCPRVAAFGRQKKFHFRGFTKLPLNWRLPIHIDDFYGGEGGEGGEV